jgi:hypothetical protein
MWTRSGTSRAAVGVILVTLTVVLSGCRGSASPPATPSVSVSPPPTSSPSIAVAASYKEYGVASCAAWEALFRAVGNPDTASGSDLSLALDAAVTAGDVTSAERLAGQIATELKAGRAEVAIAAGWQPRALAMVQFDRVFVGYEAMIAAKLVAAKRVPLSTPVNGAYPSGVSPQAAFEQAGGAEGYFAMLDLLGRATPPPGETAQKCANVPVMMP